MKRRLSALMLGLGIAAVLFAATGPVHAALGEAAESVASDSAAIEATGQSAVVQNGYTVRELRSDAVTLREYVNPNGIIFAVAWNGQTHPDLAPLLGSYAGEYRAALQETAREPGRRRLRVKTGQITVEKWGHMRNLQGRAYLPALIPPGVNIDEIQ